MQIFTGSYNRRSKLKGGKICNLHLSNFSFIKWYFSNFKLQFDAYINHVQFNFIMKESLHWNLMNKVPSTYNMPPKNNNNNIT